jgi:hypothetical protein
LCVFTCVAQVRGINHWRTVPCTPGTTKSLELSHLANVLERCLDLVQYATLHFAILLANIPSISSSQIYLKIKL